MNESNKLAHTIIGALVTWSLTIWAWAAAHIGLIAGLLACVASIYTIRAGRATARYWNAKHDQLTSRDKQEPEEDNS